MIVADHTKFNQSFPARYCEWNGVDVLVSDQKPLGALGETIRAAGCVMKAKQPD